MTNGMKKNESAKVPRYINTRVDDIYPVRKSTDRCKVLFGKDKAKKQDTIVNEMPRSPRCAFVVDHETVVSRCTADVPKSEHPESSAMGIEVQGFRRIEKCSQNALRNVVEIHLGNEKPSDFAKEKALKVLVARDKSAKHSSSVDSFIKDYDHPSSTKFFPEFQVPGNKVPLDFTLKSAFRLISSSSVKW
ncbi:hypothetical protein AXF42_Ash021566 [Apostasia shenzhenica]|uniref:Uncharacterized protein n=1 Tax=Apostasia shenzhenica TaxID=1088818 RepID=A0A2H9ZV14_9ASPA|nr:hypothetical protein AXF42_Ash021566 [Apostasia shenzhenica]